MHDFFSDSYSRGLQGRKSSDGALRNNLTILIENGKSSLVGVGSGEVYLMLKD